MKDGTIFNKGDIIAGKYRVEKFIGGGGMADVYQVFDKDRGTQIALKRLKDFLAEDQTAVEGIRREANAYKQLTHPNIIPFYGLEESRVDKFILAGLIDGPSLKKFMSLRDFKPLSEKEALIIFKALCSALGFAHNKGVVHCDVKPANVLISSVGNVYLTDFGIARHAESTLTEYGGKPPGTAYYMAPEQFVEGQVDATTDIYALGVLLFEVLTGKRPFTGAEEDTEDSGSSRWGRIMHAHRHISPPNPREYNPNISEELANVILKALSKDPSDRFQNTQEFLAAVFAASESQQDDIPDRLPIADLDLSEYGFAEGEDWIPNGGPDPRKYLIWAIGIILVSIVIVSIYFLAGNKKIEIAVVETSTPTATEILYTATPTVPTETPTPSATPAPTNTVTPTFTPTLAPAFAWITEVLHQEQSIGYWASLVIDDNDDIHMTYFQDNYDMVWYARTEDGQWQTRQHVRGGIGAGFNTTLALDSEVYPHIAYNSTNKKGVTPRMHYDYWDGKQWKGYFRNPDYKVLPFAAVSVALGPDDIPHFVFMENYANNVVYSSYVDSHFENFVVGKGIKNAPSLPLIIDESRNPRLVFQHAEDGLVYATLRDGIWQWEVVDPSSGAGLYADLALDISGNPHISYYNSDDTNLYYANKVEDQWEIQLVDDDGDVGYFASLEVDNDGNIHIGYQDISENNLKYAHGRNGNWDIYLIDDDGDVGSFLSLGVFSNGTPVIAYQDMKNEDLKFARGMPKSP